MVFAYDFPHKKTQDFIHALTTHHYKIDYVISAPWKKLPTSSHLSSHYKNLVHPRVLCERLKIPYHVLEHNNQEAIELLRKAPVDLSIVSGARILSPEIIKVCRSKILNLHPGLLPEIRGLDTLLWSIYYDYPIGISAHLISSKIDCGTLIYKELLKLYPTDSLARINQRLVARQSHVLLKALTLLSTQSFTENLDGTVHRYNSAMPKDLVEITLEKFSAWRKKYSLRH